MRGFSSLSKFVVRLPLVHPRHYLAILGEGVVLSRMFGSSLLRRRRSWQQYRRTFRRTDTPVNRRTAQATSRESRPEQPRLRSIRHA